MNKELPLEGLVVSKCVFASRGQNHGNNNNNNRIQALIKVEHLS